MKKFAFSLGIVLILMGALFAAQGSGLFPYPATSFMIAQTTWIWRGLGLVILGVIAVIWSRRPQV